jgi:hypothetical protein
LGESSGNGERAQKFPQDLRQRFAGFRPGLRDCNSLLGQRVFFGLGGFRQIFFESIERITE